METFDSKILTILWEENVQMISFVVLRYVCIYKWLFKMIVGIQLSSGISAPNSGNNHNLTIPFGGRMQSFKILGACAGTNQNRH